MIEPLIFIVSNMLLSGVALGGTPASQKWLLNADRGSGAVEFTAIGRPSALKIHGKGSAPHGSITIEGANASGKLSFDLDTLDTGIKTRNDHMKQKFLETGKYGNATLVLTKFVVPDNLWSRNVKADSVPFTGTLSLHGVEKSVTGVAHLEKDDKQMKVSANFGVKTSDYGIATPSFAGITMAEDVQVTVELAAPLATQQ